MKILITGATGMLGVKVVQALLERVPTEQLAYLSETWLKQNDLKSKELKYVKRITKILPR